MCVPLPQDARRDGRVDMAAFWGRLSAPVVRDSTGQTWVLGAGTDGRNRALAGALAPDFALPALAGAPHRLGDLRGSKVFLCTGASW